MEKQKELTAGQIRANRLVACQIKKLAIKKLKLNILCLVLGAITGFVGLTYSGALNISCLAEKGYAPQSIVQPYNNVLLKVKGLVNG